MTAEQRPARTFATEDALRAEAVRIAHHACDGDRGRVFGDPIFNAVTEGRQRWKGYSACGDLCQYVLRELGLRDERIVNRDDDDGVVPWQIGKNLSKLVFGSGSAFVWAYGNRRPKPGDILYMSKSEHVAVLESLDETGGRITTFDYGLWDPATGKAAGKRRTSPFAVTGTTLTIGTRPLHGWLDLARLPGLIVPATPEVDPCATCPHAKR